MTDVTMAKCLLWIRGIIGRKREKRCLEKEWQSNNCYAVSLINDSRLFRGPINIVVCLCGNRFFEVSNVLQLF